MWAYTIIRRTTKTIAMLQFIFSCDECVVGVRVMKVVLVDSGGFGEKVEQGARRKDSKELLCPFVFDVKLG